MGRRLASIAPIPTAGARPIPIRMERVYSPDPIVDGRLTLTGPEAHHLSRVRRASAGDAVEVFDGRGHAAVGRVESTAKDRAVLAIDGPSAGRPEPSATLTLATAVPKGERFDWLIEKATELGVARLVPLRTARSVVDPRAGKLDRLRRHVVEACKQSGRNRLMELAEPVDWEAYVASEATESRLIAHPNSAVPIGRVGPVREAVVAIGPEGGFTDVEVERALACGWRAIGLGGNLLRIETAGLTAVAALLAQSEGAIA